MKKLLVATAMTLALTTGAFAQRGGPRAFRPNAGTQGQPAGPWAHLKEVLNLTDAQVSAMQALVQANQQQAQTISADLKTKRQAFDALLNGTSPNPTDVGNAALAVHADEKQLQSLRTTLIGNIRNTLTSDQQVTFDTLVKAGLPIPGLGGFGGPGRGMRGPRGGQ